MKEDKQAICTALAETLKLTRGFCDLIGIEYVKYDGFETATLVYRHGKGTPINVTCDSGEALIRDIMRKTI